MSAPQQNPNSVDVSQASELTGLSKKALRRRVERGTLESVKVGGKRLIPISELENHDLLAPSAGAPAEGTQEPPQTASAPTSAPNVVETQPRVKGPDTRSGGEEPSGPWPTDPPVSAPQPVEPPASPPQRVAQPTPVAEAPPPTPVPVPQPAAQQVGATGAIAPGYPPGQPVPAQAPPYGYPPDRGAWGFWYRYPALRWLAIILVLALIGLVVWLLFFRSGDEPATIQPGGGPVGVSEQDLIALSQQLGQPIYWAGTQPGTRLELTETGNSYAYLRYLGEDTPVGDTSANFLTVGTYPSVNAFKNLNAYAAHSRAKTQQIQKGGVAVVIPGSPTSVYFAYPHEDVQVEVYDPQPQRALDLVKSGVVRPVTVSTSSVATAPSTGGVTVPTTTTTTPSQLPAIPQG